MAKETRSQRLQVVIDLAEKAESEAARRFEAAKKMLAQEFSTLGEIEEYYSEYKNKFGNQRTGVRAADLMSSREFLGRLSQARDGQRLQVDIAEKNLEAAREAWRQAHLKHKGLCNLVEQYRHEEWKLLEKIEQKNLDEWVSLQR